MSYIPLAECKHGWAYLIHSRNLIVGIFDSENNGFVGIREKFGSEYLFTEFHWDTGTHHGTVHPKEEIEECPVKDLREAFDAICFKCQRKVHFIRSDKYGHGTGDWEHAEETPEGCLKVITTSHNWGRERNQKLFDYLKGLEKRIQKA